MKNFFFSLCSMMIVILILVSLGDYNTSIFTQEKMNQYSSYIVIDKTPKNFWFHDQLTLYQPKLEKKEMIGVYDIIYNKYNVGDTIKFNLK